MVVLEKQVLKVKILNNNKQILANYGQNLLDLLRKEGYNIASYCGGTGQCGKCYVEVDGEKELSCSYKICKDISVKVFEEENIVAFSDIELADKYSGGELNLAIDIGTTVISIAVLEKGQTKPVELISVNNPQIKYGIDVISRISYAVKGGQKRLEDALISTLNDKICDISKKYGNAKISLVAVAANTVMLHCLFKEDIAPLGTFPYTPKFLNFRKESGKKLGFECVDEVVALPGINSFVGADVLSGLSILPKPSKGKYNMLIDLGTNAELVIFGNDTYLSTSSSAGPCFEGGHISCGMTATKGAIYSFSQKGSIVDCKVIESDSIESGNIKNGVLPKGLCGTGVIDVIASLYDRGIIDKTGALKDGQNSYTLMRGIHLTQQDIRTYQLAKAAIRAGINILIEEMLITEKNIETVFLSGGISSKISIDSAVKSTLIPASFYGKTQSIPNSSMLGLLNYLLTEKYLDSKEKIYYLDLASHPRFQQYFIHHINFA